MLISNSKLEKIQSIYNPGYFFICQSDINFRKLVCNSEETHYQSSVKCYMIFFNWTSDKDILFL